MDSFRDDVENAEKKKKNLKNVKKCTHSAPLSSPGRWTGNKIISNSGRAIVSVPAARPYLTYYRLP